MEPAEGDLWLPLADAARVLGRNERTLRTWLTLGRIRGRRVEQSGRLEWRVYVGEAAPSSRLQAPEEGQKQDPGQDPVPSLEPGAWSLELSFAREQFQLLLAEHQRACARIGVLEEQLRDRIPAIEAGTRAAQGEVKALAGQVTALAGVEEEIAAALVRTSRRIRVLTVLLVALSLLCAAIGGMSLARQSNYRHRESPSASSPR